jgi:membrane protease YdiL (CAAX protease family)
VNRSESLDSRWNKVGAPLAAAAVPSRVDGSQYSLIGILAIWAAAAVPMAVLGWVVAPLIGDRLDLGIGSANSEAFSRAGLLTVGLIWQFVLAMAIVWREEGDVRWSTIRRRCWLQAPTDPRTRRPSARLWLWLIPLLVLVALIQMASLQTVWESAVPFLAEPDRYSFEVMMSSDERKTALEGAWHILGLFLVLGLFNTFLGEELLFRGILLPRMRGVFGRADWLANGLLFGLYHLHQPWAVLGSTIGGALCYAFPSARFRSAWFGIIIHSAETVIFVLLALGLVLGLA